MFLIKILCYLSKKKKKKKINRREKKIQAKVLIEEKKKYNIYIYILLHFKSFKSLNSLCNSFLFSIKMSV